MKKQVFIIIFASLLLLCACQPTPEEPPVLQKDQDLMIHQGEATLPPEQPYTPPEVPERFTYDFADGTWTVHADAPIVVPDVPMPMVWVRSQGISQETLYRLFHLLNNGEVLSIPNMHPVMTKKEIAEIIQHMTDQLEDGSYKESDLTEEEWKESIEEFKKQYQTAPMEANNEMQESDGTYMLINGGQYDTDHLFLEAYNTHCSISATSYFKADGYGSHFQYYRHLFSDSRNDYSWANAKKIDATSELPDALSYADSVAMLNHLIETIGEPFEIASVYLIDDAGNGEVDGAVRAAEHYALCFVCHRLVNGAPTVCDVPGTGKTDQQFSIPWEQESFRVIIDRDGFVLIRWNEPLTMLDTVSESTNLLSFSEIKGIAEKMLPILYGKNPTYENSIRSSETHITSVRLELIRVREQNNVKQLKGILVPVWAFYGTSLLTLDGYSMYADYGMGGGNDYYEGDQILLCINAIDGTIIDPLLGY